MKKVYTITDEMIDYIKANTAKMTNKQLAEKLGITLAVLQNIKYDNKIYKQHILSQETVKEIVKRYKEGQTRGRISNILNLTHSQVTYTLLKLKIKKGLN